MDPISLLTALGSATGGLGKLFGGGSGGQTTNVSVGQSVSQSQVTNVGSGVGGDLQEQLAYLLGASPVSSLPPTTSGSPNLLTDLFTSLGVSPATPSIADSRYSPLTGGVAQSSGINLNMILIFVAVGLVILVVIKKMKKRG